MKLNICILLRPDFKPNIQVCPQVGVCSYLSNFGHSVTWVIWAEESQQVQSFSFNDVPVYATPQVQYLSGSSLLIKILNIIPNIFRRMRFINKIFREGKYNLILVNDFVYDGLIAAYIKWRYKVPFVFTLRNPLEQDWEAFKIDRRWPIFSYYLVAKFNKFIATHLLHKADLVLPISKWLKEHLVEQGIPESKIIPCPNGVDMNVFSNREGTTIRKNYHLDDSKVIIYVGIMERARYLGVLIQAFTKVKKEKKNVKLLMVGGGGDERNLRRLATELGVGDDVVFTGKVPHPEVPNFIAAADIGVSPVPPLSFYIPSSPIKLFEYMAMAKPVVANEEILEHKEVVEESGGGILVPFTPEAFADAIIELLDNSDRATEMGRRGREWVVKHRTYEVLARRIEQRLLSIAKQESDNIA